jgi:PAS domain S-box-containing protein
VWDPGARSLGPDYPNTFTGDNVRRVLGLEPDDLAKISFFDRIHPDDRGRATLELEHLLQRGRSVQEYRFLHGDGTYHWVFDENVVIDDAGGQNVRIVGFLADVTEQHEAADQQQLLAAAMDQTTNGILLLRRDGVITFANAAMCEMSGRSIHDLVGAHSSTLAEDPALEPVYQASMAAGLAGKRWSGSITVDWRRDRPYNLDISVWPLIVDGSVNSLIVVLSDTTAEHVLSATVDRQAAERSAVSEAFSRLAQGGTLESKAAAATRELIAVHGVDVALVIGLPSGPGITRLSAAGGFAGRDPWLFFDGCGNYLRRQLETARTLEDWSEHRDAHEELSCTWGQTGLQAVRIEPLWSEGVVVGGIIAGSMVPDGRTRLLELAPLLADFGAMVAALLAPDLARRREVNDVRTLVESVLADREFGTVFQPEFDLETGTLVGYEALTRFTDGTRPDLRFAQADAAGLGLELEAATLASAIEGAKDIPAGCWLSLNASPELILEHARLAELLAGRGERAIVLEVTEHAVVGDYVALQEAVTALGEGVQIAVDDAGAGFSSLRHVIELQPDFVKLDIGLIRGIDGDDARRALVAGMAHFATETGCLLVAEGIETAAELAALRTLGVGFGQGFLLGRPGPLPPLSA